jgi:hypothetical protein
LILKNDGELFKFDLAEGETKHTPEYKIEKIADNVKTSSGAEQSDTYKFNDILSSSEEMQTAIESLVKAGVINGTGDTEFSPEKAVNRAEAAAMLLRMTGKKDSEDISDFVDVTEDKLYYNTAGASQKYGIINGYEDNTFRGDEDISALQLISINARVLRNEKNIGESVTVDVSDNMPEWLKIEEDIEENIEPEDNTYVPDGVPEWCRDDIKLALQEGLITEEELERFLDNDSITRSEAAVILYRLYDRI